MDISLNESILKVKASEIRRFNDYAKSVNCKYFLTLGEPDFYTPENIKKKAIDALDSNKTKYAATPGNLDLREAIASFELKMNGCKYSPDEILVTHGSTEALTAAFFTMLNKDDEVIVPIPAYPMYRQIIEYAGGKVVTIDTTTSSFEITKKQLEKAITAKTKAIIINSPNNPTGSVYSDETLEIIHDMVKDKPIFVICDDVYNQIIYGGYKKSFSKYTDLKDQIIVCQSYSKSYAMPGWRAGYMMGPLSFINHAKKIHQYMIVCLNTFIQDAMIEALSYDNTMMVESYEARCNYVYDRLIKMGFEVKKPNGAFYILPSIKKFGVKSWEFCEGLAKEYKVALIPGIAFEADDYIRISYCVNMDVITHALDALEEYIKKLGK